MTFYKSICHTKSKSSCVSRILHTVFAMMMMIQGMIRPRATGYFVNAFSVGLTSNAHTSLVRRTFAMSSSIRLFSSSKESLDVVDSPAKVDSNVQKIPVILLAGFLGTGKTSTLQHLLKNQNQLKMGIIVNDVASMNIDAKLIMNPSTTPAATTPSGTVAPVMGLDVVELQNGCVCCSLQDELLLSVEQLIQSRKKKIVDPEDKLFDAIVVELTGVADPEAIQANWKPFMMPSNSLYPDLLENCQNQLRVVTVVDACTFGTEFMTWDTVKKRPVWIKVDKADECSMHRKVSELLVEQIEAAHVLLVNKIDIATREQISVTTQVLRALNPNAEIFPVEHGRVEPHYVLGNRESAVQKSVVDDECLGCNDPNHSHDHHDHETVTAPSSADSDLTACNDPSCAQEGHSHSHDHSAHGKPSPDRTQRKSTSVDALGFVNFVYKADRPFHIERLLAALKKWPVPLKDTLDLGLLRQNDSSQYDVSGQFVESAKYIKDVIPFLGVVRSKGFCWMAPYNWSGNRADAWRHDTAMYWSHAGRQFGLSTAGKWWATVPDDKMKSYFVDSVKEYERIRNEDFVSEEYGDRRQEIVFIGTNISPQKISATLDVCLLTDQEMKEYRQKLRNFMETTMTISNERSTTSGGLFDVDAMNHTDL
jgi:G3E family GTPase